VGTEGPFFILVVLVVLILVPILVVLVLFFLFFFGLGCSPAFGLGDALEVHLMPGLDIELLDVAVQIFDLNELGILIHG